MPSYYRLLRMQGNTSYQFEPVEEFKPTEDIFQALETFLANPSEGVSVAIVCCDARDDNLEDEKFCSRLKEAVGTGETITIIQSGMDSNTSLIVKIESVPVEDDQNREFLSALETVVENLKFIPVIKNDSARLEFLERACSKIKELQYDLNRKRVNCYRYEEAERYTDYITSAIPDNLYIRLILLMRSACYDIFEREGSYFPSVFEWVVKGGDSRDLQMEKMQKCHQAELQVQAERYQAELQAQAERYQAELQAQAERHQAELQAQAERHQAELAKRDETIGAIQGLTKEIQNLTAYIPPLKDFLNEFLAEDKKALANPQPKDLLKMEFLLTEIKDAVAIKDAVKIKDALVKLVLLLSYQVMQIENEASKHYEPVIDVVTSLEPFGEKRNDVTNKELSSNDISIDTTQKTENSIENSEEKEGEKSQPETKVVPKTVDDRDTQRQRNAHTDDREQYDRRNERNEYPADMDERG